MLRLLHTADWHLGHSLHGHSRAHEHADFLSWLSDLIAGEHIDALLIAGDVFDSANPPASALSMYYEFLADVQRQTPGLDVVIVGGNHDSAARLNAPEALLSAIGVTVVGGLVNRNREKSRGVNVAEMVVPLRESSGAVGALVAAVPFMRPADLPVVSTATGDPLVEGVREAYSQVLAEARRVLQPEQALIAMGHCHMVGSTISQMSERRVVIGNQHALPDDIFPDDVDYVALGHLHKAQRIGGREHVRYSGSPIPLSMGEAGYHHQVAIADFEKGTLDDLRIVPVPRTTDLLCIGPGALPTVLASLDALEARREGEDLQCPYLEVGVRLDSPVSDLRDQIEAALKGKRARLVKISISYTGDRKTLSEARPGQRLADVSPHDVLLRRYSRDYQDTPPQELLEAFDGLLDSVGQKGR